MKKIITLLAFTILCSAPAFAKDKSDAEILKIKTEHCINKADTNKDGSISKEEHDAAGQKMFSDADTNSDSKLSKEEVMATKKKEMEEVKAMTK